MSFSVCAFYLSFKTFYSSSISELREPLSKHCALLEHSYRKYTNKTGCDYKALPGGQTKLSDRHISGHDHKDSCNAINAEQLFSKP